MSPSQADTSWLLRGSRPQKIKGDSRYDQDGGDPHGIDSEIRLVKVRRRRIDRKRRTPLLKIAKSPRQPVSRYSDRGEEQSPAHGVALRSLAGVRHQLCAIESNVQIDDFKRVFFDEFATRFHVFAHQRGEDNFGGNGILKFHL